MVKSKADHKELQRFNRNISKLRPSSTKVAQELEIDERMVSSKEDGNFVVNNRIKKERVEETSDDKQEASLSGGDSDEMGTSDEDESSSSSRSISEEENDKDTGAEQPAEEEEKQLLERKSSKEFSQKVNEQSLLQKRKNTVPENKANTPDSNPQKASSSPAVTFESLGVIPQICQACTLLNWHTPTQIQKEAIPHALQGRDIIGLAETGSGKTGENVDFIIATVEMFTISSIDRNFFRSLHMYGMIFRCICNTHLTSTLAASIQVICCYSCPNSRTGIPDI